MLEPLSLYLIFGCLAGVLSGLFGIGGGAILVPFLIWEFTVSGFSPELVMVMSVATSLATIIITSVASAYAHHRRGAVDWNAAVFLAPGVMLGSVLGSIIADQLPVGVFKFVFAIFLMGIAARLGYTGNSSGGPFWSATRALLFVAGSVIGTISAIVGIGGGSLSVPFLSKCRFGMRRAVATSSACGFPIAVAGTTSYIVLGWQKAQLPADSLGYIYIPAFLGIVTTSTLFAPLGARLAHSLPTVRLKRLFALMLLLIGCRLLWQAMAALKLN